MKPIIYFATDHAGFDLKNELLAFVRDELSYEVFDCGAYSFDEHDDFTTYIKDGAEHVSRNPLEARAIILGGSGQGEAMLANRYSDVRATVYYGGDTEIIRLSRTHNDANILSLGARFLKTEEAKIAVRLWLETEHIPVLKYDRRNQALDTINVSSKEITVVPSIPPKSFQEVQHLLEIFKDVSKGIQIDLVDGVFVPHTSWPFTELDVEESLSLLKPYAQDFEFEVDCMCMHPEAYLQLFKEIGIKRVIIHEGTTEKYAVCIREAKKHGYKIGLGILNSTPKDFLASYADTIDFVQVMGIAHIGIQGQPFDTQTLDTVAYIHLSYPHLEIAVDGAVNRETILKLKVVGVTRFAPGSAVVKASDPVASYKQLDAMIER